MKKYSKILVLILSLAIICTGLILAVSAEDETPTFDLVSAIQSAKDGDTIVMTGNAEITASHGDQWGAVAINKNLTIDLNGYTITTSHSNRAFNVQTVGKLFTITGSGTINATAGDLFKTGGNNTAGIQMNVIGTGKGITINHSAASNVLEAAGGAFRFENVTVNSSSTTAVFNASADASMAFDNVTVDHTGTSYLIQFANGSVDVKNSTIKTATAADVFYTGGTGAMSFVGVNVTTSKLINGQKAVFNPGTKATVSLDYCRVETKGHSIFATPTATEKVENYIVVDHSYLMAAYGNGGFTSLLYNSYGNLGSDVVISNSFVSWNSRILVKHSVNNTALIFKNTEILFNGKQGNFFRSLNVKLEEGSWMHGNHSYYPTDTTFYSNYDNSGPMTVGDNTSVYLLISEGARFDEATYNKLIKRTGLSKDPKTEKDSSGNTVTVTDENGNPVYNTITFYNEGYVAYPDGSSPTSSTTYKMVFDPIGNPDAPYVVVKADAADTVANVLHFSDNPQLITSYHETGTAKNVYFDSKNFYSFTSNGKLNSDGKAPNYMWGIKHGNGIAAKDHGVFVFEFDLATDSEVGFTETLVNIHARDDAAGSNNKATVGSLFKIKKDGTVYKTAWTLNEETGEYADVETKTDVKLSLNSWNHVTIVVDTSVEGGVAYAYVNGVLVNTHVAYEEEAYLFGPRFNPTNAGAKDTGSNFIVDNIMIRTGEDAVTDNGLSYLVNGGKTWNSNYVYSNAATVGGVNIKPDVESILTLQNELGVVAKLNKDIIEPQTVVTEGTIFANGHTINVADGSVAYAVENGADGSDYGYYVFDDAFAELVAKYQFYTSLNTDAESLADPNNWTAVGETDINTPLSTLYAGAALPIIGKYSDTGYLTSAHIGWATTPDASEPRTSPATEDEAKSGEVIKLYPVLNYKKAYSIVILDANGNFNRGFTGNVFWGSGLRKFEMKYGETLVLNANVTSQASIAQVFGNSADPSNANCFKTAAGATEEKYNGFDFNGFTWTVDTNYQQNGAKGKATSFAVYPGETLNIYSSRPGGAYVAYGNATDTKGAFTASGGVFLGFSGNSGAEDTIAANANGEVTQNNAKANVGTVTMGGKTIPGSNLSIYTAVIADIFSGDNTCEVNFDGVTAVKNSPDYSGMFIIRKYFGKLNITNATIINALNDSVFHGHEQGYVAATETTPAERALADVTVDNCLILTHANGGDVINKDYSFNTIKFTNCVTNGKLIKDDFGALVLGEGNKATEMSGDALAEGVVRAKWNNAMPLSADVSAPYFTLVDQTFTSADKDYNDLTYVFSVGAYEGEDGIALPILGYTTVAAEDALDVTYTDVGTGKTVTEYYAKGANVVLAKPENYEGTLLTVTYKDTWTVNGAEGSVLPTNIQENVTILSECDVVNKIEGLKANLSLYSDFVINVYIPADYAQYITSVNGAALAGETVTIGENNYYKVTASKVAKEASDAAVFEIALAEGGYVAAKTVSISITDYASTILAGEFTDADKILMYNMLSFVGAASEHFEGKEDAAIAALLETYAAWNKVSVDKSYSNALADTGLGDVFASAGIVLGDAPAFTLVPNGNFAGTVTVTYGDGNVRNYTVNAGSVEAIKIEGMKIFNFGVNVSITAVGTVAGVEQTVSGTLNLDTYAKYQTANAEASVVAVVEALYNYVKIAEQYKAGTLVLPEEAPAE
ncbi:MAG: hypothetical protein IJD79_08730 [Clostridia bacterium]|nr:hypothetical protein [Clostridia bacterium]